ncbi:hypothetical protein EUA93_04720 [Nocardioides oleivorans]|uniref:SIR2-like domain-containing protein n=1 Tax=Nocardioides oleivorans TaxID=273676 RepID=A0A4Q2RWX4_9ACTN|nr:AbiH family protein [Nocardioides oleivorans]RYB93720.1 hypothetical protein EUA93_04720 [Nocardioides oleivorans]
MGFRQFGTSEYADLRTQHNVMALVGNGFDIQVTRKYRTRFSPRYTAFYHYLHARDFDSTNVIVQQMAWLKDLGRNDWSDLEGAIASLLRPPSTVGTDLIYEATVAIQEAFSEYLELVAPPSLLAALGKESSTGSLAIRSMSDFVGDVTRSPNFEKFHFPAETSHYDLFNFMLVNLNYTPLLDDYMYRDPVQWQPRQFTRADRNFQFHPNPTSDPRGHGNADTGWSSYLRTEVVHPHGQQAIPRSLLFGIDAPDGFDPGTHPHRKLMKPYWAMTDIEYGHLFAGVELFIIFGCSLGVTDGWWWRRTLDQLRSQPDAEGPTSELIIYWWSPAEASVASADVISKFLVGAGVEPNDPIRCRVEDRIQVVVYTDLDPPVWLAT